MSLKRIFSERGSYDVTMPVSVLQQRCNELTNVMTNMADSPTENKAKDDQLENTTTSTLQRRCNELTNGMTNMADLPTGNETKDDQPENTTPTTTTATLSTVSPTSSPPEMMKTATNMHVDAVVEVAPAMNIGFRKFEMDYGSEKADMDIDTLSNVSKEEKCENCILNCLYFTNECCGCKII